MRWAALFGTSLVIVEAPDEHLAMERALGALGALLSRRGLMRPVPEEIALRLATDADLAMVAA